jgi:TonB family protein
MKKAFLFLVLVLCPLGTFAQDTKWVRVEAFVKEIAFKLPEDFFFYRNKDRNETYFSSYQNNLSISISIKKSFAYNRMLSGLESRYDKFDCKYDFYPLGELTGKSFTCEADKRYSRTIYIGSDDRYYKITIGADSADNAGVSLFLMSLRLRGAAMFPKYGEKMDPADKVLYMDDLKNSPLVKQYLDKPDSTDIHVVYAKDTQGPGVAAETFNADSPIYSRPLIVLRKSPPAFPNVDKSGPPISVNIRLKVQFLANGQIGNVEVLSSPGVKYAESAIEAVKKIKFIPAQKDGKDVDISQVMEFGYRTF